MNAPSRAPVSFLVSLITFCLVFLPASAWAQTGDNPSNDSTPAKAAPNSALVVLPPAPRHSDLQHIPVAGGSSLRFFIDLASISRVGDTLVRYTLVAQTPQGLNNVSYEGLDCAQDNWHIYAVWSAGEKRWIENASTDWHSVNTGGFTRVHAVLDTDYLCKGNLAAGSVADIAARLKAGLHAE